MFEHIDFAKVLVMGYPRAGTHICAVMIAYDTGLYYVHESAWGNRDAERLWNYIDRHDDFVTPCPGIDDFRRFGQRDDVYVVLIRRPTNEIRASSLRVKGGLASLETPDAIRRIETRYAKWEAEKSLVRHYVEIDYSSLSTHPLWIDAEDRTSFVQVQVHPTLDYSDLVKCRDQDG